MMLCYFLVCDYDLGRGLFVNYKRLGSKWDFIYLLFIIYLVCLS